MEASEIFDELDILGFQPLAFDVDTFIRLIRPDADPETVRNILCNDPRFIRLCDSTDMFIWHASLFEWFSNLNIRLAKAHEFKLSESQLTNIMNELRLYGRWNSPPLEAILWAQSLGLISRNSHSEYVFPIAKIISYLSSSSLSVASDVLENFYKEYVRKFSSQVSVKSLLEDFFREIFPKFGERVAYIIQSREEFLSEGKITLQQIASHLGITRERVRQLEKKFWNRMLKQNEQFKQVLVVVLLRHIMEGTGSLIVRSNSSEISMIRLLAKCLKIPSMELQQISILILGTSSLDSTFLKSFPPFPHNIETNTIASYLESQTEIVLNNSDIKTLADRLVQFHLKRMTKTQRVYLALRSIGRPAHYTKVAEIYDTLFPTHISSERNVHAALARQEHGIVWIGIKGVYAFKEWGFERPTKTLFDTVVEIVKTIYERTGRPVPFSVITAEIGKYRKVVNLSSLKIATSCNPKLRRIYQDCFVLKAPEESVEDEISADQVDKILQEFRQES